MDSISDDYSSYGSIDSDYGSIDSSDDYASYGSISYSLSDVSESADYQSSISSASASQSSISDSSTLWSIMDLPSFLDYEQYEVHHWGMIVTGLVAIITTIAYFLVFRKNAKYRHLIPSAAKKNSYDQLDEDLEGHVASEDETYTYEDDDDSPRV